MTKSYHFIGIGGIGMSGLARILISKKIPVSGSDIALNYTVEGLIKSGAVVHKGHSADVITPHMTVVYSTDIKQDNPEYLAAIKMQCAMLHRSDLLAELIQDHQSFAVAGTHGKTTTSALLSLVFVEAGLDPSFAVGGMLQDFHANSRFGQGEHFIFEADESDKTFLKYHPYGAIVTNIDNDHLNNYEGSMDLLIESFSKFMGQVEGSQHLFWCAEDRYLRELNKPGKTYGFSEDCDWKAFNIRQKGFTLVFDILGEGQLYRDVELARIGKHNVLNGLAVFGLARSLGINESAIRKAFKSFKGVMRRCETKGEMNHILFIDDYAHHPTEIQVTLQALQQAVKGRRLIAVFQPHRYSRTRDCLGMYGNIFDAADEVIVTDIFGAGETPIPHLSHTNILEEIQSHSSVSVQYVPRSALPHMLAQFVQPHDVVVTLGAGDVTKVGPETLACLEKQAPKKLKIGLAFGGSFSEHEVSIRSAEHFRNSLSKDLYEIENIGITKRGTWIVGPDAREKLEKILQGQMEDPCTYVTPEVVHKAITCDVFIPVLHGPGGEDGMIQGFFEILGKAYVGCDLRSAALCMDKLASKKIAIFHGLSTAGFIDFPYHDWQEEREQLMDKAETELVYPLFVKPIHLGSSIGVRKVHDRQELEAAIDFAFQFDTHLIIENGIKGREIEFAVLGNDVDTEAFPPGEILTGGAVYDYESKYSANSTPTTPRADISHALVETGRKFALQIYKALGCRGLTRLDFFLDGHGKYWFNEANPMPGFTSISLYPQICAENGIPAAELLDRLIILGMARKRHHDRLIRGQQLALRKGRNK